MGFASGKQSLLTQEGIRALICVEGTQEGPTSYSTVACCLPYVYCPMLHPTGVQSTRILRSAIKEFDCIPECLPAAQVHEDKASRSSVYRFERRAHQSRVGYSRAVRIDKKDSKGRATYAQRVPYRRDQ